MASHRLGCIRWFRHALVKHVVKIALAMLLVGFELATDHASLLDSMHAEYELTNCMVALADASDVVFLFCVGWRWRWALVTTLCV